MKTLLTGHSGFVGRHVQDRLDCVPLADLNGQPIDIADSRTVAESVGALLKRFNPDTVIHLAAQSNVPAAFAAPEKTYQVNFFGTLNLLSALERSGFKGRMLFVGSGDTYGSVPEEDLPVREIQPLRPRNPYAVSKVAAEALCYQWSKTGPFEIVMARPFNHIGPGQSENFAVSDFAKQLIEIALGLRPPTLTTGDIDVTRDFTDVRDIVEAYALLLEKGENGEAYNVGSGIERSIRSIVATMAELASLTVEISTDPARFRPAEQRRMKACAEKLTHQTGWTPRIPLEQSLTDILDHWKRRLSK